MDEELFVLKVFFQDAAQAALYLFDGGIHPIAHFFSEFLKEAFHRV